MARGRDIVVKTIYTIEKFVMAYTTETYCGRTVNLLDQHVECIIAVACRIVKENEIKYSEIGGLIDEWRRQRGSQFPDMNIELFVANVKCKERCLILLLLQCRNFYTEYGKSIPASVMNSIIPEINGELYIEDQPIAPLVYVVDSLIGILNHEDITHINVKRRRYFDRMRMGKGI